ncbi:MAG: hypothetical protein IPG29_10405 [Sphingobacteriales bacterium]|nr:hypothetical protein [Sphingobacteriales bacterium]
MHFVDNYEFTVVDIEATGGSAQRDRITEIAVYRFNGNTITQQFCTLINPSVLIPPFITQLTGITNEMVANAPTFDAVAQELLNITQNAILVAHNAQYDYAFIRSEFKRLGIAFNMPKLCTVKLSRELLPHRTTFGLDALCTDLAIPLDDHHRAYSDALATLHLLKYLFAHEKAHHWVNELVFSQSVFQKLPPQISAQHLNQIPEEPGKVYYYNQKGKIIYIDASADIRSETFKTFRNPKAQRRENIVKHVNEISWEVCGNTLIAELEQLEEINKHQPSFNRMGTNMPHFGIFKSTNSFGYTQLRISPLDKAARPQEALQQFNRRPDAVKYLERKVQKHNLCPALCGLERPLNSKSGCSSFHLGNCLGACCGKEKARIYNHRLKKALRGEFFQDINFIVIDEGRSFDEKSAVLVQDGLVVAFGYFNPNWLNTPYAIAEALPKRNHHHLMEKVVKRYLGTQATVQVIPFIENETADYVAE